MDLPAAWIASVRLWAVDEPVVSKVMVLRDRSTSFVSSARRLKLAFVTTSNAYGDTLAPFIERRAGWIASLEARLQVKIELQHYAPSVSGDASLTEEALVIWPRPAAEMAAH